jgi:O-antigen/teichoic acid export membrane protein
MGSSLLGAGSGFIFWVIAARFYSAEDVGLASAIVSAMRMIGMLSIFGLDLALIRYIPEKKNRSETINSAILVSAIAALLFSSVFVIAVDFISPSLGVIKRAEYLLLFIGFTASLTISGILGQGIFVAFRKAEYTFLQSVSTFLRLFILPFLISFNFAGIFLSFGAGMVLAFLIGITLMLRLLPNNFSINLSELRNMIGFSSGAYFVRISENLPGLVLPIIVLNVLGSKENAYFFVAWSVMFFITMIPRMTSISLLAEGSHEPERLTERAFESVKFVFLLTVLAVFVVYVLSGFVLQFFGKEYTIESLSILRILLIGCIPYSLNIVYAGAMLVRKRIGGVIGIYGGIALVTITVGYVLMSVLGIDGVGYGWVVGNLTIMVGVLVRHYSLKEI